MGRAVALSLLLIASAASATEPIRLDAAGVTGDFDIQTLAALLRLELGTAVAVGSGSAAHDASATAIRIVPVEGAESSRWKIILLHEVPSGSSAEVDLADVPPSARARTLALAIGELARNASAATPPNVATRPQPPSLGGGGSLGLRTFPNDATTLLALSGEASIPIAGEGTWKARIAPGVQLGRREDPLGSVTLVVPSFGAGVLYSSRPDNVQFELGPLAEVGYAIGVVSPRGDAVGESASGWVITAGLTGGARFRLTEHTGLTVGLQLGHVVRGLQLRAEDRRVIGVSGPMLGLSLGFSGD